MMWTIRPARLEDTAAISALFLASISAWQRIDAAGQVHDVPYAALTIYERWLHGGAWLSIETATLHLSHLLRGGGVPLVAEHPQGGLVGYLEAYRGLEPSPLGDHLEIGRLQTSLQAVRDALIAGAQAAAQALGCSSVTVRMSAYDSEALAAYAAHGFEQRLMLHRLTLTARAGQGFYKVADHPQDDAAQIHNWHCTVGGAGSARYLWERLWPRTFDAVPEIAALRVRRVRFSASGQEAFVHAQQMLYNPRNVELVVWSPRALTAQMLTALRDWCYQENYRTLVLLVSEALRPVIGAEAESDGYSEVVLSVPG